MPSVAILSDPEGAFARNYNRKTFTFAHGLASNPLFDLPNLVELGRRTSKEQEPYWSNGKVAAGAKWEDGTSGRMSLTETIENIARNDSIVILKHTEQDPVFGPLLREFLGRVVDFAGEQMRSDVLIGETLILISSPNRVTPFHFDVETNFLVQVRGDKWFHVFDQNDRTLVSNEQRERYFTGDISSAVYRPDRQKDATTFDLKAGMGVHVPVCAPHWVQNRDNVSVAISVNYELRSVERDARIHRVNGYLRRLGLTPTPPRMSAARDSIKLAAAGAVSGARSMFKGGRDRRPYEVWRPSVRAAG